MDLAFLAPDARRLHAASVELCACCIWSDQRPTAGLAGLLKLRERLAGKRVGIVISGGNIDQRTLQRRRHECNH